MRVLDVKINLKVIIAGHTVFASKCFTECKRARYRFFFVSSAKVVMKKNFYEKNLRYVFFNFCSYQCFIIKSQGQQAAAGVMTASGALIISVYRVT